MSETHLPLIVEPDHLERVLGAEDLLVVDVSEDTVHAQHHVPGAVHLAYQAIIAVKPPAMGLLPDSATQRSTFGPWHDSRYPRGRLR